LDPIHQRLIADDVPEIAVFALNIKNDTFDRSTAYMWKPLELYVSS
jgi:hypothetical protein